MVLFVRTLLSYLQGAELICNEAVAQLLAVSLQHSLVTVSDDHDRD